MSNPPDHEPAEGPLLLPPVAQRLLRHLWAAAQTPNAATLTSADLAARLAEQGEPVPQQTVVAILQALAAQHYVRLVLVFATELEVIVTAVAPALADLLEPPPGGED